MPEVEGLLLFCHVEAIRVLDEFTRNRYNASMLYFRLAQTYFPTIHSKNRPPLGRVYALRTEGVFNA
jgi:hypothetical protein